MILEDEALQALRKYLIRQLEPISEAEPAVLAKYVIALLKKDLPNAELQLQCEKALADFLKGETRPFVNRLFEVINNRSFLSDPSPQNGTNNFHSLENEDLHEKEEMNDRDHKHQRVQKMEEGPSDPNYNRKRHHSELEAYDTNNAKKRYNYNIQDERVTKRNKKDDDLTPSTLGPIPFSERYNPNESPEDYNRRTIAARRDRYEEEITENRNERRFHVPGLIQQQQQQQQQTGLPLMSGNISTNSGPGNNMVVPSITGMMNNPIGITTGNGSGFNGKRGNGYQPYEREERYMGSTADKNMSGRVNGRGRYNARGGLNLTGRRPRCRDYDEKGYCFRGELCPYDHGHNIVIVDNMTDLIAPNQKGNSEGYNPDNPLFSANIPLKTSSIPNNMSSPSYTLTPPDFPPPGCTLSPKSVTVPLKSSPSPAPKEQIENFFKK